MQLLTNGECDGDGIADGVRDCDGNVLDCAGNCGGGAVVDECGECDGDGIADGACDCDGNVLDCAGECGGDSAIDECGICDGDGSSCEVYIELEVSTSVDESELEDLDVFEENFESFIETELGLPFGSVEVTNIIINENRDVEVTVEFTITLTDEELVESDFEGEDDISDAWEEVEEEVEEGGLPEFVYGCADMSACNYDEEVTNDDGSRGPVCSTYPIVMEIV